MKNVILNVDDNDAGRYVKTRTLRNAGFDVIEGATGESALTLARDERPDLVLLDVNLPDISGFEVCRRLRGDRQTRRLPIVHISATFLSTKDEAVSLDAGADIYLAEPVDSQELISAVRTLLRLRATEKVLAESEERFRTLFESMGEGFCVFEMLYDADGRPYDYRYLEANPMFEKHTGLRGAAGRTMRELAPDQEVHWLEIYARVAATGESERFINEARAVGRWFEIYAFRLGGSESRKVAALFTDITDHKRSEENLRVLAANLATANRRQTEFLATLAHELRNPLAPLRNGLEIMRIAADNPGAVSKARDMMERQFAQMVHLVDDLIDIARITGGKVHLKKERVELRAIVDSAIETVQPLLDAARQSLRVDFPDEPLSLDADPTRLSQVVSNLLSNASKYSPADGRIVLTARSGPGEAIVTVSDNGVGLAPESLSTVFDLFAQVDGEAARGDQGLGIGLALVRQLVELHGGSVAAASEGPGQGTTFTIRLPSAPELPARDAAAAVPATQSVGRTLRILVVDDNLDAAESLAVILQLAGHETRVANDGEDALQRVQAFAPDVVFLDIGMPRMSGYEVARALRSMSGLEHVTLVALTGWGTEQDRDRAREAGFDAHLTKPAELDAVDRLLSRLGASLLQDTATRH